MRKDIFLPLLALLGGGAGFVLRLWQVSSGFDRETRLFRSGLPATWALLALLAALAVLFLLLPRGSAVPTDYAQAFYCPSAGYMTLMAAGGFVLLACAALGALEGMEHLTLWRAGLSSAGPVMQLLTAGLAVPAGLAALILGKGNYRGSLPQCHPLLAALWAYLPLPWIVEVYQNNSRQPETMLYLFPLLAAIATALAFYCGVCFAFENRRPRLCLFFSLMGVVLLLTALADRPSPFHTALSLGCVLLLLAQSCSLIRNTCGPYWPAPQAGDDVPAV